MNAQAYETAVNSGPIPVIFRRDSAGNRVAFLQQELDLSVEGGRIKVWHEGHQKDTSEVPLTYYHSTTKLSESEEADLANKFAEGFQPKFGISIRKRLGKDLSKHVTAQSAEQPKSANSTLRRAGDKQSFAFNQEEYRAKMQIAIQAAIAAVDAEYANK